MPCPEAQPPVVCRGGAPLPSLPWRLQPQAMLDEQEATGREAEATLRRGADSSEWKGRLSASVGVGVTGSVWLGA